MPKACVLQSGQPHAADVSRIMPGTRRRDPALACSLQFRARMPYKRSGRSARTVGIKTGSNGVLPKAFGALPRVRRGLLEDAPQGPLTQASSKGNCRPTLALHAEPDYLARVNGFSWSCHEVSTLSGKACAQIVPMGCIFRLFAPCVPMQYQ
jgi:hypothetical protein